MDLTDLKNRQLDTWLKLVKEMDKELAVLKADLIKLRSIIDFAKKELEKDVKDLNSKE